MQIKTKVDDIKNYDGIPSVTGILSLLELDSFKKLEQLPNWDKILKEAGIRGTYVHNFIEDDLNGKTPRIVKKHKDYIKQWIIYKNSTPERKDFELEKEIITKNLGGTIDYIEEQDNGYKIIDWKTSSKMSLDTELIQKYKLQMGGYALLFGENKPIKEAEIVIFTPIGTQRIYMNRSEIIDCTNYFNNILYYYKQTKRGQSTRGPYVFGQNILKVGEEESTTEAIEATGSMADQIDNDPRIYVDEQPRVNTVETPESLNNQVLTDAIRDYTQEREQTVHTNEHGDILF